jgi:hypothetical protein
MQNDLKKPERRFFSRTAFVLWISATIGAACVLPYVNALTPALGQAASRLGIPVYLLILLSVVQSCVMLAILTFSGLWAARKLGMGAPLLDAWLSGEAPPYNLRRNALAAVSLGLASGVVLLALDLWLFLPLSPHDLGKFLSQPQPPAWTGLLASFEGGMTEEVQLRLFLLSFLALGLHSASRLAVGHRRAALTPAQFWTVNLVVAVIFGLGHLPITSHLMRLTPVIVTRAIVLNGVVGLVAGYLFWRRGIEMAMLAHFSADVLLHVIAPLLQPFLLRMSGWS